MIQIIINTNKDNIILSFNKFDSIYEIKHKLYKKYNYKIEDQILTFSGKICDEDKSLYYYNIENNSILSLSFKLKGGFIFSIISFIFKFFNMLLTPIIALFDLIGFNILSWILLFMAIIIFFMVLLSGVIPLISNGLYITLKEVIGNLNTSLNNYIEGIDSFIIQLILRVFYLSYWLISQMILLFVSYGFVYLIVAYISGLLFYKLSYKLTGKDCSSIKESEKSVEKIGYTFALIYYGLKMNIFEPIIFALTSLPECFKPTALIFFFKKIKSFGYIIKGLLQPLFWFLPINKVIVIFQEKLGDILDIIYNYSTDPVNYNNPNYPDFINILKKSEFAHSIIINIYNNLCKYGDKDILNLKDMIFNGTYAGVFAIVAYIFLTFWNLWNVIF